MSIRKGDPAAPFTLASKPGNPIDVGAHFGKDPVVLLFMPLAFSPVCSDELCAMRDNWQGWADLGAHVYGITVDSPFVTEKFRAELDIPFPVLSDFNKTVATQYGALHEDLKGMKGVAKRAVFVVDGSGTVVYDWVTDNPGDMPDLDAVRSVVAGMGAGAK